MFTPPRIVPSLVHPSDHQQMVGMDSGIIITNDVHDTRKLHLQQTEHKSNASPLPLMFCIHFYV